MIEYLDFMSLNSENVVRKSLIIKEVNDQLSHLLKFAFEDYVSLSNSLGNFYNKLKEFYNESGAFVDKDKIEALLESLNQIIIDLQFHDIIRQKLEHIEGTHVALIKEMDAGTVFEESKYLQIYPEIAKLHVAQLEFIQGEYAHHSKSIKQALQKGVGNEMSSLENFVFDFSDTFNHTDSFSDTIATIVGSLKILSVETIEGREESYFDLVLNIKDVYSMRSEREVFNELFGLEEEMDEDDEIELF